MHISSAFDTVFRDRIIETAVKIIDEDEAKILRVLLSNITLEVMIKEIEINFYIQIYGFLYRVCFISTNASDYPSQPLTA